MKKKEIIDLITAHYEDDPRLFFRTTIEILKEFKANGDDVLVEHLDFILKGKVKIAPKRIVDSYNSESAISFEDAVDLGWVPMMETQGDKNE